jgi:hypothetical protein
MNATRAWAAKEAERLLAPLGRRWSHVQSVAARAEFVAAGVGVDPGTLAAAAFMHDIGYAAELAVTGFHPLDGARFVRDAGHEDLATLVAHHTGARNEATLRGLDALEREFPFNDSLIQRALTYSDLTTGPDGTPTNVRSRVAEIMQRYGPDHVVSRAALVGLPEFLEIEAEIEGLLQVSGSPVSGRSSSR